MTEHTNIANGGSPAIGTAIKNAIETGTSNAVIKLGNTNETAFYATLTIGATAGTVNSTSGVLTFGCTATTPYSDASASAGTAVKAQILSRNGVIILNNISVGTSGAEINLTNNVFVGGEVVKITSLTYEPPA